MLIWLLAVLLFAFFAALGYFKGAIRMMFPLLGLFVGIYLAFPLSPLVRPLIPKMGLENPVWSYLLPPVIIFFLIALVFVIVGFFGHAKINLFYKYRTDDTHRISWERLNQRLGICMGMVAGTVYTILIGLVVHILGYTTVQITTESEESAVRYLNQAKVALQSSGLDRLATPFDPTPEYYYQAADVMGLLYHNQPLHTRLASYPPFISLSESSDFEEFATDTEFLRMLSSRPAFADLINHPHIQTILGNEALLSQLGAIDLEDLNGYLLTGVSEKYQDPPILGRWEVDDYLTFLMEKKRNLEMTAADVRLLRFKMEFLKGFLLYVMPDNTVKVKGPDVGRLIGRLEEIEKAVRGGAKRAVAPQAQYVAPAPTVTQADREMDQVYQNRYGVTPSSRGVPGGGGGGRGGGGPQQPAAPQMVLVQPTQGTALASAPTADELAAEIAQLEVVTLADGNWSDEGGRTVIHLRPSNSLNQFLVTRRSQEGLYAAVRKEQVELDNREPFVIERLHLTEGKDTLVMAPF